MEDHGFMAHPPFTSATQRVRSLRGALYQRPLAVAALCAAVAACGGCGAGLTASKSTPPASSTAATPTFSPAAGTYTNAQSVTIGDATSGAAIYYTTDGTTPTASSTKYSGAINIASTETIEAIAVESGYTNSAVSSATYTISPVTPVAATPTFSPAAGTYTNAQSVTIGDATSGAAIYYTTDGTTPTASSTKYSGVINIASTETIEAIAVESGYTNSAVSSATYTISPVTPVAATPTFSPAAGTFTSAQSVAISAGTGCTIYYTTNGTTPATSSTTYTGPITVSSTETVEAIATCPGYSTSTVGTAIYTISSPNSIQLTPFSCCDGVYVTSTINGQQVWQSPAAGGYLYFIIPASFNAVAGQPLYVAVQYYDTGYTNKLAYQYDSTQGAFSAAEVTLHSSMVNSGLFQTAYFEMATPALLHQEDGGTDFRIYGINGQISIASVTLQNAPFDNPAFQFALTKPWLTSYPTATTDASTLTGKTVAGYQGWFSCPNDMNDGGWVHWSNGEPFVPTVTANWPDISLYPANSQYPGAQCQAEQLVTESGQPALVFSSNNPDVVAQHFAWMKEFNIDGIFLQRFLGGGSVPGANKEWVLGEIRKSASQNGRIWTIEYDVSELNESNVVATIEADWKWLVDSAHILQDGNYTHHNSKPVVVVWGLECRQNVNGDTGGYTPDVADTLIEFFKTDPTYGGNYVIGGICNTYNTFPNWIEHYQRYDGLQVWQPQNNAADKALFTSWGVDWWPAAWVAHTSAGQDYWTDLYNIIVNKPNGYFIGMFDEYGEGTEIIPITDDPPAYNPPMLTNQGKPLTWWLQLSDYGKQMMLKQIPLNPTMPSQ